MTLFDMKNFLAVAWDSRTSILFPSGTAFAFVLSFHRCKLDTTGTVDMVLRIRVHGVFGALQTDLIRPLLSALFRNPRNEQRSDDEEAMYLHSW